MLSGSRPAGFSGISNIPLSEIKVYLEILEINDYSIKLEYVRWIQFIDSELVKLVNKDNKK